MPEHVPVSLPVPRPSSATRPGVAAGCRAEARPGAASHYRAPSAADTHTHVCVCVCAFVCGDVLVKDDVFVKKCSS